MLSGIQTDNDRFLADLGRIQDQLAQATRRISSGYRVAQASDDPQDVGTIFQYSAALSHNEQITHNLQQSKVEADTAEQAVASTESLLDQVIAIGAQGATGTLTATDRVTLANQVTGIVEHLVTLANSQLQGRYLFSGDADQTPPYAFDATQPNGVTAYAGSAAATRQFEDTNGSRFPSSRTAQQIFDDPGGASVFAAVWSLRTALLANDPVGAANATQAIKTSRDHVAQELSFYGSVQSEVAGALDTASKQQLQWKTALSALRDADLVAESIRLSQLNLQQQAALQSHAQIGRRSLFDYLG
jgi:flagellar hook-associated protein 3 FlgL